MLVVIALGGNALLRRGQTLDADSQRANVAVDSEAVAAIARDHHVVLTYANVRGDAGTILHPDGSDHAIRTAEVTTA